MEHLFIASADTLSPRWRQAFPLARILMVEDLHFPLPPTAVVWLLLDGERSQQTLAQCLAQGAKVVVMTRQEHPLQARHVIAAGASGYVHYLATSSLLQQVTQVIAHGGVWLGGDLMRELMLLAKAEERELSVDKLQLLTPRERAVAEAVASGNTNKEVARMLEITERTVKAHLGAIFEKLGVRDRLQLVLAVTDKKK